LFVIKAHKKTRMGDTSAGVSPLKTIAISQTGVN
jgi:hypothetical protein